MHEQGPVDFIEVIHNAVPSEVCAAIVERLRATRGLQPGAVGSGVFPELKHSKDLRISGLDGWQDVDQQLQIAVFNGLLTYLRRYPQALIAPLMLQIQDSNGQPRRLSAEDFPTCRRSSWPIWHLPAPGCDQPAVVCGGRGRLPVLALRTVPEGCAGRDSAPARAVDAVPQRRL